MRYDNDDIREANRKFAGRWIRTTTSGIGRIGRVEPFMTSSDLLNVHFDIFIDTEHISSVEWMKDDIISRDRVDTIDLHELDEKRRNGKNDIMYEFIDRRKAKAFISKARRALLGAAGRLGKIKV